MKILSVQIFFGFLSLASIQAGSVNHPKCYICGSESDVVTNPNAVIPIPDDYEPGSKEACKSLEEAGKDGQISEDECADLQKSTAVKNFCGCRSSTEEEDSKPSDMPVDIARPVENKSPAVFPSTSPMLTELPTTSPDLYTEDVSKSGEPSISPSDFPSDSPSSVSSNFPSEFPSEIPSSEPSLDAKDISGVDSSTDTSGTAASSKYIVAALGIIFAMTYSS